MTDMIADTGHRLFAAHAEAAFAAMPEQAEAGAAPWQQDLWQAVEETGMPLALLSEGAGGFGIAAPEALSLVRIAAAYAAPIPLGETMLANWLFAAANLPLAEGPASVVRGLTAVPEGGGWRVTGRAARVPYGRHAKTIAALTTDGERCARLLHLFGDWSITEFHNIAAEPRDDLLIDLHLPAEVVAASPVTPECFTALGAMLRAQALAGALEAVLEKCVTYANERVQFGRPIGRFQAIQHNLAVMAGEVAAARAGADRAAVLLPRALDDTQAFTTAAATAKLRAGDAAGIAAAIAHQVHGAIGFTGEYPLHPLTRRLWAWREEYGNETFWAEYLGGRVCSLGPGGFWPFLTDTLEDAS